MKPTIALPVTIERSNDTGKVFLHDDQGRWIGDINSLTADDLAAKLNANDLPLVENQGIIAQGGLKAVLNRLTSENATLREQLKTAKAALGMLFEERDAICPKLAENPSYDSPQIQDARKLLSQLNQQAKQ